MVQTTSEYDDLHSLKMSASPCKSKRLWQSVIKTKWKRPLMRMTEYISVSSSPETSEN